MPLNIEVNADFRITSDERNVIVQRKYIVDPTKAPQWIRMRERGADPTPRTEWREASYHATVAQAVRAIGEQQVRDSDAGTLAELLAEIKRFNDEIATLLAVEGKG